MAMASEGQAPLLAKQQNEESRSQDTSMKGWRRGFVGVSIFASIALVVASQRQIAPQPLSPTLAAADGYGNGACYAFTGNGCTFSGCLPQNHATCSSLKNCICTQGCVGASGACNTSITKYDLIASGVRIKNVKWPDQYLFAPSYVLNQLRTTSDTGEADKWTLYKAPGLIPPDFKRSAYVIVNDKFPDYTAQVATSNEVQMFHVTHGDWKLKPYRPQFIFQSMCKLKDKPHQFKIAGQPGTSGTGVPIFERWYLRWSSSRVFGWSFGHVGDGGHWEFDPPLPADASDKIDKECP